MSKIIIKTPQQIEAIRKSCQLAADALMDVVPEIKPGVSTYELDQRMEAFIRRYGGIPAPLGYKGYPAATCISLNEEICHGVPKEGIILKDGDLVKIDVSTILNGYFGDTCKTFGVGQLSVLATSLKAATQDCLDFGVSACRPGARFGAIGSAISKYARSRGFSVVRQFVGHGVGLELHEPPNVRHDDEGFCSTDEILMQPGMVFTIEPMINVGMFDAVIDETDGWTARTRDGSLSAQFEHTVLITEDGVEVLTR